MKGDAGQQHSISWRALAAVCSADDQRRIPVSQRAAAPEQAKGVLAERMQIGVDEAFAVLRGGTRSRNMLLSDIAREIAGSASGTADVMHLFGPQAAVRSEPE